MRSGDDEDDVPEIEADEIQAQPEFDPEADPEAEVPETPKKAVKAKVKAKPAKATQVKAKAKKPTNGHAKPVKVKATKPVKAKGAKTKRKARTVDPSKLDQFGFRLTSMKSKAASMYASKAGATLAEVKAKLDSNQFNLLTELAGRGFKIDRKDVGGDNGRNVTKYRILTK